jgi:cell division protein FtsI/penicillin-binding protein 2
VDRAIKNRLVFGCALLVLLLSSLSVRLFHIEAFRSDSLAAQARGHYEAKDRLPARRGRIFDRSGELLARSQTVYSLEVDPYHLRDPLLACIALGARDQISPQSVRKRHLPEELSGLYREYVAETVSAIREGTGGAIVLAKNIEDDFARQVEEIIDAKKLGGVILRAGERRYYPSPLSLTQVIGYVDENGMGVAGVEKIFEEEMRGTDGFRYCERDRSRREIRAYRGEQVDPVSGRDVYLTIDMGVQAVVERELDGVIDRFRPAKATVIILDPSTGEVLAMASRPHFDLSTRKGIRGQEPVRRNPAVSDLYQPGSTFKIVGFGGAFDRGLADPATEVDCHMGQYALDGFTLKDHHPYGRLTARLAFAKSSNIGAFLVSRPLNKDLFHHYVKQFGFGSKTGIELNAEHAGRVIPVERWSAPSFSSQVMGYEVSVTPMQMAMACSVIANDGVLLTPTILHGVKQDARGADLVKGPERTGRRVLSVKAAQQVLQCMTETMTDHGTGSKGDLPGYSVAGKTGTARKHVENVGYVDGLYVASFMGFLPAENPKLLGLVVIDEPKANGSLVYGGAVAAPVFQSIAAEAVRILGIDPDLPEELQGMSRVPLAAARLEGEGR